MTDQALHDALRALWRGGGNSVPLGIEQDFKCIYCGGDLLQSIESIDAWNIDHLDPTVSGPEADALDNTTVACKLCNFAKRDYQPKGDTKAERLADARRLVLLRRAEKQARLDEVVQLVTTWRAARQAN